MSARNLAVTNDPPPEQKVVDDLIGRMIDSFAFLCHMHLFRKSADNLDVGLHILNALCSILDRTDPKTERALIEVMRGHVQHFDESETALETATPAGAA